MSQWLDDSPKSNEIRQKIKKHQEKVVLWRIKNKLHNIKKGEQVFISYEYYEMLHDWMIEKIPAYKNLTFFGAPNRNGFIVLCTDEERWMY